MQSASPKWRRRADRRPDEILDAALAAFNERGFDATRVEDIARGAGLSKAGVYLYFGAKEDILRALIEREIAPIVRNARALAEEGRNDPLATLRRLVATFAPIIDDPHVAATPRVVLSIAPRFPEIGAYYRENVVEPGLKAVAALHRAGVEKGVFRPGDSELAARAIMAPIVLHMLWRHVLGADPGPLEARARAEAQLDIALNGLLADRS